MTARRREGRRDGRSVPSRADDDAHASTTPAIAICPHVDANDARCSHRFSLGRIDQAFGVCFGAFHGCPVYHCRNAEIDSRAWRGKRPLVTVALTVNPAALRKTGT